jgi:hypothetical protein
VAVDTEQQTPEDAFAKVLGRDPFSKKAKPVKPVQDLDSSSPESQLEKILGRKLTPSVKKQKPTLSERTFGEEGLGSAIGVASKAERAVDEPIEHAEKFVHEKIDQAADWLMKPQREQTLWLAAHGYPTLSKLGAYSEAVNPVNLQRETLKLASGLVVDPKNWPFLLTGAAEVRPALKTVSSALFTVMQQTGAIEALRNRDWANAAIQEAFALLGLKDLPAEVKAAIGREAVVNVDKGIEAPPEAPKAEAQAGPVKRGEGQEPSSLTPPPEAPEEAKTAIPSAKAEPSKDLGFMDAFASAEGAITDSFVDSAWNRLNEGKKLLFSERKRTLENKIQQAWDAGNIKSRADIERIVKNEAVSGQQPQTSQGLTPPPAVPESSREAPVGSSGTEAGAQRDTDIMARLAKEHPDWSLSKRLQESAKITNPVPEGMAPPPESPEGGATVESVGMIHDPALADIHEKFEGRKREIEQKYPAKSPGLTRDPFAPPIEPVTPAKPGQVAELPVDQIVADPSRFQFRYDLSESGLFDRLEAGESTKYDPKLAGILAVWTDPADGKTYVVNGHHRLELAKRTGQTHVLTRSLDAADAQEARAQGALINIAEGHATEVDAAKFFRDTDMTADDLKDQGISLSTKTARGGLALSKLSPPIFERVVHGDIPVKRGIVIGEELSEPAEQAAMLELINKQKSQGTKLSDDEVRELARFVKDAGTTTQSVDTLFGEEQIQHSNAIEKAQLSSWVKKQLAQDKKLFGFVAKAERAKELSRAGNIIDVDKSSEIAQSSKIAEEVYNRLIRRFGPVSDAIDEGAVRLGKGEDPNVVRKDIYRKVREAVAEVLPGTKTESVGSLEKPPSTRRETGTGEQFVEPPEWELDMLLGREVRPDIGPAPPETPDDLGVMQPPPSLFDSVEPKPLLPVDRPSGTTEPELQIPGPGAKNVRTVKETPSDIIQLKDSLAAVTQDSQSMQDRMHTASRLASTLSKGQDLLTDYWNRVKTNFAAMWNAYTQPHAWTDFKHMLGEWQYADQRAEHEAYLFAQEIIKQVPDKMKRQAIVNYIEAEGDRDTLLGRAFASKDKWKEGYLEATTLSDEEKTLAANIQNYFESRLQAAIDGGLLDHGVENYVHRIVKHPDKSGVVKKLLGEVAMGKLQTNPRFAKKRLFETSFDVEQSGLEHVNKDVGFLITAYDLSFNRALSARAFVKTLLSGQASDGRPLVSVTGSGVRINDAEAGPEAYIIKPNTLPEQTGDYKSIDHPALRKWKWAAQDAQGAPVFVQGDLAVHPEAYQHLKNVLSRSALQAHPIGRAVLKAQGTLKSTMLSASLFHQEQIGTHAVGHWVNPTDVPEVDWDDPRQQGLIKGGLQIVNHRALEEFSEGVAGTGLTKYIPVVGPKLADYQEYLFGDYIPRLKMKMAMAALERNKERYPELSADQLNELTANQANAAFGELNYKMLGRNPTFQDAMRLVLLAPDFLEARGRFAGQALKPYGREQATALIRIGGIVYGGARVLNMAFNDGDPKWDKPFSVVIGGHEFSIRSIPGDIYHLATNPRSFFLWRMNPFITRPAIELMYGRDAYGRKQTAYDQGVEYLKGVLPISVQKWPEHVYQLAKDELGRKDTGPDLTDAEKDFLDGLLNSIGVRESVYRSPAADLAHKKMLDALPSTVSKEVLDHGRKLHEYEMEFKAGELNFDRMKELVKSGDLTQKDIKTILSPKGQYDDLQRSMTNLSAKDGMEVWKLANRQERAELANQMVSKVKRSRSMTAQEKSAAMEELIRDINASETMAPPPPYTPGLEEPPSAP